MILLNPAFQRATPKLAYIELDPTLMERMKKATESATRRQIVQTEKGQQVQVAPKQAFLGEKNQEVDRETVSRDHRTVMASSNHSKQAASPAGALQNQETPAKQALSSFGIPILPSAKELANRKPQGPEAWSSDFASNAPSDYIKGLKESERTALNTKEYIFYGYFQRIRERLDRAWVPILRERLVRFYRTGRQLASDMDHKTRVMVVLDNRGEIIRVQVLSESGTRDLDEAAIKAFNQAGPFPNPPHGIVDPNGLIQIPWEFILKT